jgi:hypothetical protein
MIRNTRRISISAIFGALLLSGVPGAARAEPAASSVYRTLAKTCAGEITRLCPAVSASPYATRSQAICLKPYKFDLSLGCRRAVKAIYP